MWVSVGFIALVVLFAAVLGPRLKLLIQVQKSKSRIGTENSYSKQWNDLEIEFSNPLDVQTAVGRFVVNTNTRS